MPHFPAAAARFITLAFFWPRYDLKASLVQWHLFLDALLYAREEPANHLFASSPSELPDPVLDVVWKNRNGYRGTTTDGGRLWWDAPVDDVFERSLLSSYSPTPTLRLVPSVYSTRREAVFRYFLLFSPPFVTLAQLFTAPDSATRGERNQFESDFLIGHRFLCWWTMDNETEPVIKLLIDLALFFAGFYC